MIDTMNPNAPPSARKASAWRPIALMAAVIAVLVLSYVFDIGAQLGRLRGFIDALGWLGPVVFVLIYAVATVAAIPGSALTIAAGGLFGSVVGVASVIVGATLGACLAFLVARYFARDAIAAWLGKNEKFRKLDRLTETHGAIIVALTRLVPVFPFNLLNYGFGLTRVTFLTYALWSFVCMIPGTVLYVVGADAVTRGLEQGKIPWALVAVFGAAIGVLVLIVRAAKKKLQEKEKAAGVSIEADGDDA
ncbi:TVP38/TMEM64 family protein [bacterium]|nr:TVP38/TMEM64 family protein [bacterium]